MKKLVVLAVFMLIVGRVFAEEQFMNHYVDQYVCGTNATYTNASQIVLVLTNKDFSPWYIQGVWNQFNSAIVNTQIFYRVQPLVLEDLHTAKRIAITNEIFRLPNLAVSSSWTNIIPKVWFDVGDILQVQEISVATNENIIQIDRVFDRAY